MPYINTEVFYDLADVDDEDLIEELESRGMKVTDPRRDNRDSEVITIIENLYNKRRLKQDYQEELDELIYQSIGRI